MNRARPSHYDAALDLTDSLIVASVLSKRLYKLRWRIEAAFARLKDFRRVATRYDKLARNYVASVCLAAALAWWIKCRK